MRNKLPEELFIDDTEPLKAAIDKMLENETRQVRRALLRDLEKRGPRWVYGQLIRNIYGRRQNVSNTAKEKACDSEGQRGVV